MNAHATEILIADEDPAVRLILAQAFTGLGHSVRCTSNAATVLKWADGHSVRLAIIEAGSANGQALDVLRDIRKAQPTLPIIMTSPQSTLQAAVSAAEVGAFDYLPKPLDLDALLAVANRALTPLSDQEARRAQARAARDDRLVLVGRSAAMQDVYRIMGRLAAVDLPVLVLGECGAGKARIARALHDHGRRRQGPFVAVNLASLEPARIEETLLGQAGGLAQAEGGALFLDGVEDLTADGQTRLLRVLEQHANASRRPNVQILAAADARLPAMVEDGRFRRDLYLRLGVALLRVPPLRDRSEDIGDLARAFLLRAHRDGLPAKSLHGKAVERLAAHDWPGNVRELENLMRRVCVLHAEELITAAIVDRELAAHGPPTADGAVASLPEAVTQAVAAHVAAPSAGAVAEGLYPHLIHLMEQPMIRATLQATGGNQMRAAEILGINRNTLRRKMEDHGLAPRRPIGRRG